MFNWFDVNRAAKPRCSVHFDGDGTWSVFRGVVLLASGLSTVTDAWDVIDHARSPVGSFTSATGGARPIYVRSGVP